MKKQLLKIVKVTLKLAVLAGLAVGGWYAYGYYAPAAEDDVLGALPTAQASYRDITVSVQALGVLQPIKIIEIKSRASGEILEMPVEVGDAVAAGDIIVQVDTSILDQELIQAEADLLNAQVALDIAKSQFERSQSLFDQGLISQNELEGSRQTHANAEAQLVRNEATRDLAKERLADATVRAPSAGTVIAKTVEEGQIIASSSSDISGGTTLIQMADLSELEIKTMVEEVDIGQIKPGLEVESKVEAFADRDFYGKVVKIEPEATVRQSVTSFPVLSRIDNSAGKLLPGMNADVSIVVHRKPGVLAVPNEGVRTPEDANRVAMMLGLIEPQGFGAPGGFEGSMGGGREGGGPRGGDSAGRGPADAGNRSRGGSGSGGESAAGRGRGRDGDSGGPGGRGDGRSGGFGAGDRGAPGGERGSSGGERGGSGGDRGSSGGRGGQGGMEDMRARFENASPAERARLMAQMRAAFEARSENPDPFGIEGRREDAVVFVMNADGMLDMRNIVAGARDWEFTEVLEGLSDGDEIVLLPSTALLEGQDRMRDWARRMGGGGIPGMGGGGMSGRGGPGGRGRGR